MQEKRKYERFDLRLFGKIVAVDSGTGEVLDVETTDVSAGGAFLHNTNTKVTGERVKVTLTLVNKKVKELACAQGLLKVAGTVVRSSMEGTAISFNGKPEVVPMALSRIGSEDHLHLAKTTLSSKSSN